MLAEFRAAAQEEIQMLRNGFASGMLPQPQWAPRPDFAAALRDHPSEIAVIAEYKRASPSRGIIREDLDVEDAARMYEAGGCAAISILTEKKWFKGNFNYLDRAQNALRNKAIPILRKDFIFHPVQIRATAATGAAAVLLIVRSTPDAKLLGELLAEAGKWNLQCVTEVFNEADLRLARDVGARIIQVNARDLETLEVNRNICLELIAKNPPQQHEVWIAASGMEKREDIQKARDAGFAACLVGSSLMSNKNPGQALAELLGHAN